MKVVAVALPQKLFVLRIAISPLRADLDTRLSTS